MRPSSRINCHATPFVALLMGLQPAFSAAQTQVVKPPVAQYWMDVATMSMAGMDDMPALGGLGGMAAGMMGMKGLGENSFGSTKGMMPGRWLDIAVTTQRKPAGTQGTQTIPAGMAMGPSLALLPPEAVAAKNSSPQGRGDSEESVPEQPKGRILLYWGCGDTVRAGQPKVLDFSTAKPEDYAQFMRGRATRERGAVAAPGNAIWPNAQHKQMVPKGASLVGSHQVTGDGIPPGLQFAIAQAQDFMPPLGLQASGGGAQATQLRWAAQANARALFLTAMSGSDSKDGGSEMVLWSSAESPEPGWGLMDYLSPANLDKWLADKTLLPGNQTECAIPAGIFAKADSAMVRGIAYGQELNLAHPPRPTDKKIPWAPDWAARIRVKSVAMLPLDGSGSPHAAAPTPKIETPPKEDSQDNKSLLPAVPGVPGLGNVLKGLFGR